MDDTWRKSTYSLSNGHCAEVASWRDGAAVRDSRDRSGPVLRFCGQTWGFFLTAVRDGTVPVSCR